MAAKKKGKKGTRKGIGKGAATRRGRKPMRTDPKAGETPKSQCEPQSACR
jgi:hypothetical protein